MSHMYIVDYDDMFRSNSTIFRSLKTLNPQGLFSPVMGLV